MQGLRPLKVCARMPAHAPACQRMPTHASKDSLRLAAASSAAFLGFDHRTNISFSRGLVSFGGARGAPQVRAGKSLQRATTRAGRSPQADNMATALPALRELFAPCANTTIYDYSPPPPPEGEPLYISKVLRFRSAAAVTLSGGHIFSSSLVLSR